MAIFKRKRMSREEFITALIKLRDENSKKNNHYSLISDLQAIEIIARSMTRTEFYGYCKGNILKYRLRAGKKENNPVSQDLEKAAHYTELYEQYKGLCHE